MFHTGNDNTKSVLKMLVWNFSYLIFCTYEKKSVLANIRDIMNIHG